MSANKNPKKGAQANIVRQPSPAQVSKKSKTPPEGGVFGLVARPAGFEPTTPWFVAKYSIQLSYGRIGRNYTKSSAEKRIEPISWLYN